MCLSGIFAILANFFIVVFDMNLYFFIEVFEALGYYDDTNAGDIKS